ncbi:HYR domain-containing protein [Croceiramulus getboli]|nr:HYR domain-containing protein [Flavobacteriaceae bacterium YJPT1-3]
MFSRPLTPSLRKALCVFVLCSPFLATQILFAFDSSKGGSVVTKKVTNAGPQYLGHGLIPFLDNSHDEESAYRSKKTTASDPKPKTTASDPPVAQCQDITVFLDSSGNVTIVPAVIDNGSSDDVGITDRSLDISSFNCSNVGSPVTVTLTVEDTDGQTASCTATVTVQDNTPPTVITQDITVQLDAAGTASITAAQIDNGSNDACGINTISLSTTTFSCGNIGDNIVTLTVTDNNGNTATATATVKVEDNVNPTAIAQDVTIQLNASGNATVSAASVNNSSFDNCAGINLSLDQNSFSCGDIGDNPVILTVTDFNGNVSTAAATVTVQDNISPTVITQDITVQLDAAGTVSITTADINNGSSDACGIDTISIDTTSFGCGDIGDNTVTLTVTDIHGNTASDTAIVTVEDSLAPTVVTKNIVLALDASGNASISATDIDDGSVDNCTGVNLALDKTSFSCSDLGTNTVVLLVSDFNGNTASASAVVTVIDATDPLTPVLPDLTAECSLTATAPTTTDNCAGTITATTSDPISYTAQGTYTITWTFDDGNGNSINADQQVIISDVSAPVPDNSTLTDITAECEVNSLISPTATDNCSGFVNISNDAMLPITAQGTTVITWTYNDGNGNTSTQTQNVIINDVSAPVPDNPTLADVTAECEVTSLVPPTATDNCSGFVNISNDASLPITTQGTTVVTWTYNDGNGNTSSQTQNVIVNDLTAPLPDNLTLTDVTAECEVTSLVPPTATDNCSGFVNISNDASLPITTQGTTVVTWTYDDGNGNVSTQTQNIVIDDVSAPVPDNLTLADVTAECEVTTLSPPSATDNCSGFVNISNNASLPITTQGTTVITWTFDDGNGNTSTQSQNVIIDDVTAPFADVATLADITAECEVTSLSPPSATDNCSGLVIITNDAALPITTQGTTVVTWTYDDGHGNTSTQTQNVILNDVTAPVADVPTLADITAECEVTSLSPPTATDNCAGSITITYNVTLPITAQGTTVVTWTYDDGHGNTSTQNQNVIIDDITAPVANATALADVNAVCEVSNLTPPSATDNCDDFVNVSNDASFPITDLGTTVVTWTYIDSRGNISTQTQNVIINDVTAPVPDRNNLQDVKADCEVSVLSPPTATDNCVGIITGTPNISLPITTQGTTTVIWTYDDGRGNISTQSQDIVINDKQAPVPDSLKLPNITASCAVTVDPPTATDSCDGLILGTTTDPLTYDSPGNYTIDWTFTDTSGNTIQQKQAVEINDLTPPSITNLPDTILLDCDQVVATWDEPAVFDDCELISVSSNIPSGAGFPYGRTDVVYRATDANGNTSTATFSVVRMGDNEAPTAACSPITVQIERLDEVITVLPQDIDDGSSDNCGIASMSLSKTEFTADDEGDNPVILTVTDATGQTSTCETIVTVSLENLSTNDFKQEILSIYPNPFRSEIQVELPQSWIGSEVKTQIFDLSGKVVKTHAASAKGKAIRLQNLKNLPSGIYIIQLTHENGTSIREKIVKR